MSFVRSDELGFGPDPIGDELAFVPDMLFFKRRRVTSPILGKLRIEISPKGSKRLAMRVHMFAQFVAILAASIVERSISATTFLGDALGVADTF